MGGKHRNVKKGGTPHPGVTRERNKKPDGSDDIGYPHVEIEESMLYAAAETMASFEHLGEIFGCAGTTLQRDPKHRKVIDKARAEKKKSLLAAQFQAAISDRNPTMQIWLGKQFLGQKDVTRTEHTGADGKPIESRHTKRVVAVFPDNGRRRPIDPSQASRARVPA